MLPRSAPKALHLLPVLLLAVMLLAAVVLELTLIDTSAPLWQLWLPKLPLAILVVLPWLRRS